MPFTDADRKNKKTMFTLAPEAREAIERIPERQRSAWVSKLIIRAARRLGLIERPSQAQPKD